MGLLGEIVQTLHAWVKGEAQIVAVLLVLYAIGFGFAQVPAWYVIAPLCAFLYLIPLFGSPIGLILALLVTFFADRTIWQVLAVLLVWVVIQGIEGFYLTPHILGKRTRLGPLAVFFGVIAGSSLFGFFGVLFAVPAMAVAMVIWRYWERSRTSALK